MAKWSVDKSAYPGTILTILGVIFLAATGHTNLILAFVIGSLFGSIRITTRQ